MLKKDLGSSETVFSFRADGMSKRMPEGLLNVLLKIAIILIKFFKINQMKKFTITSMTISP